MEEQKNKVSFEEVKQIFKNYNFRNCIIDRTDFTHLSKKIIEACLGIGS